MIKWSITKPILPKSVHTTCGWDNYLKWVIEWMENFEISIRKEREGVWSSLVMVVVELNSWMNRQSLLWSPLPRKQFCYFNRGNDTWPTCCATYNQWKCCTSPSTQRITTIVTSQWTENRPKRSETILFNGRWSEKETDWNGAHFGASCELSWLYSRECTCHHGIAEQILPGPEKAVHLIKQPSVGGTVSQSEVSLISVFACD